MRDESKFYAAPLYHFLVMLYVTFLVSAFATASKLVAMPFGLSASVSTVTSYAFCFIITDIISEVYGYKASRQAVRFGLIGLTLSLVMFQVAVHLPPADGFATQEGFEQTLGYPLRIIVGGLAGYFLSQQTDIFLFHWLKKKTNGRHLWLRNNISTACAQAVDSVIWITIAFAGTVPNLFALITGEYMVKLLVAVLDTAVLYLVISKMREKRIFSKAGAPA